MLVHEFIGAKTFQSDNDLVIARAKAGYRIRR